MNRQSSFIDCPTKCRILATTTYPSQSTSTSTSVPQYIQLPYNYTIIQIKNIQTYLCSSIKIVGIDLSDKPQQIPNIRNKSIYINGINIQGGNKYTIKSYKQFQLFDTIIDITIPLSSNPRQSNKQIKNNLLSNLIIYSNNQSSPIIQQNITIQALNNCTIYYLSNCDKKQLYSQLPTRKVMINRIPVKLLLPKLEIYRKSYILQMIAQDLMNAINIMVASQLLYRVVERHEGLLPIQNYCVREGEQDMGFMKLVTRGEVETQKDKLLKQMKQNQNISVNQPSSSAALIRKTSSSRHLLQVAGLVCLLIFIVGGYAAIKLF